MRSTERQSQIAAFLAERGYASLNDLVAHLGVSVSTIRRDLDQMQHAGSVRRTHGGAFHVEPRDHPLDYQQRQDKHLAEKEAIGELAAAHIREGEVVLLDGGSTTYRVAKCLRDHPIQIVTSSLPIAAMLGKSSETEVIFLGGAIMPRTGVALGPYAEDMLRSLRVGRAVLSIAGVTEEGLYNANLLMVDLERIMIEIAEEVIVVVDHSKFGRRSLVHICGFSDINHLFTDSNVPQHWVDFVTSQGVNVHVADVDGREPAEHGPTSVQQPSLPADLRAQAGGNARRA